MISKIAPVRVTTISNNDSYKKSEYMHQSVPNQFAQTNINGQPKNPSFRGGFLTKVSGFMEKAFSGLGAAATLISGVVRYIAVPNKAIHPGFCSDFPVYEKAMTTIAENSLAFFQGGIGLLLIGILASIFHTNSTRGTIN